MGPTERRRHVRAQVAATVTCRAGVTFRGAYEVQNLSVGGAYVSGGPPLRVGEQVDIALGLANAVLSIRGVVLRCERTSRDHALALRFLRPRRPVIDSIATAVREALRQPAP